MMISKAPEAGAQPAGAKLEAGRKWQQRDGDYCGCVKRVT